ncbi:MAG TPA: segregation/condensation protein A [bacterium]|nr:segregation/condensation protein A [bacterium]
MEGIKEKETEQNAAVEQKEAPSVFTVALDIFEGPMDLLLFLVEQESLSIYDIPISRITEDFLDFLEKIQKLNVEVATGFLVMSTRLMRIKLKLMLSITPEEKKEAEEEKKQLEEELLEYKRMKEKARFLRERLDQRRNVFFRSQRIIPQDEYTVEVSLFDLANVFKDMMKLASAGVKEILEDPVTLEEKIEDIRNGLKEIPEISLFSLWNQRSILELIVTFLAILELIRRKQIICFQKVPLGEILIRKGEKFSP